ncbi:MAG: hypothetical protein ABI412_07645 [Sphingomicrobium sp.]
MPGFASISIANALKIASVNLCADEYLLMLARPDEIASVTRLAQDPLESTLWRKARHYPANRGSLETIVGTRPSWLLTMGGSGKSTALIARRLGIRTLDLPAPTDIATVEANLRSVAAALGDASRAEPLLRQIAHLRATSPAKSTDTMLVSGGGTSVGAWSAVKEWMRLAGLSQRQLPGGKVTLETLLTAPPAILLRSDYRSGQMSAGQGWFDHPIVRHLAKRTEVTDGRVWTCAGPLMVAEIERLKRATQ